MGDTHEEIELGEGESRSLFEGHVTICPAEIGVDLVHLKTGQSQSSAHESMVKVGRAIKLNAGAFGK